MFPCRLRRVLECRVRQLCYHRPQMPVCSGPPLHLQICLTIRTWVLAAAVVCCQCAAMGQDLTLVSPRSWSADNSLLTDNISDLGQGKDDYLWLATYRGVLRFDGLRFVAMPIPELPLGGRTVCRVMFAADDGSVWAAMDRGWVVRWKNGERTAFGARQGIPA